MTGLVRLAVRQLSAARSVPLVLAIVIAILSFLGTAAPRALRAAEDAQVPHDIAGHAGSLDVLGVMPSAYGAERIDPLTGAPDSDLVGTEGEIWAGLDSALQSLREGQDEPLRSLLGEPRFVTSSQPFLVPTAAGSDLSSASLVFHVDPRYEERISPVDGSMPAAPPEFDPEAFAAAAQSTLPAAEIVMSAESAEILGWAVGETRPLTGLGDLVLVGTFDPVEPDESYWTRANFTASPYIEDDPNLGQSATAGVYLHPSFGTNLPMNGFAIMEDSVELAMWFPIEGEPPRAADLQLLQSQTESLRTGSRPIGTLNGAERLIQFDTPLTELVASTQDRIAIVHTLVTLLALGPGVVGGAVLVLGTRLVVDRRRAFLTQLASRGGSVDQLAGTAAGEALAISVPGAAIGAAVALALVRTRFEWTDLLAPAVLVTATLALLTLTVRAIVRRSATVSRRDLGGRTGRFRRVAEVTVVVLSLAVLAPAVQRALARPTPGQSAAEAAAAGDGGTSLLPSIALMALAVVGVLRLYPLLVSWAERRAHAGRSAVPFVALARAARAPAGGLVPVVALVVAVSVALLAAITTSTIARGTRAALWESVGADLRLHGPVLTEEDYETLAAVDGVEAVARSGTLSGFAAHLDGARSHAQVLFVDSEPLRRIQADAIDLPELPGGLADVGETVPVVVTPAVGVGVGEEGLTLGGVPAEVVAVVETLPGLDVRAETIVADTAAIPVVSSSGWYPRLALLGLSDGADPAAVQEEIRPLFRAVTFTVMDEATLGFDASPLGDAMSATRLASIGLAALFAGLVLVLTQMLDAPKRARVVAVLRTVGLRRRQAAQLAAWELSPTVVASVVAGAVVGVAVPWMMVATTDLTPLTGGERAPRFALDPVLVGGVLAVIVLVAAAAVAVSAWLAGRASISSELREVGE